MRKDGDVYMMEALEDRTFLSGGAAAAGSPTVRQSAEAAVVRHVKRTRKAPPKTYLITFYGLGGGGFGNNELAKVANDAGKASGAIVRKYQETQGDVALQQFFNSVDFNHDKVISSDEIASVKVDLLGFSFGAVQATNFSRSLAVPGTVAGFTLEAAVPVQTLVTIDPVNYTPLKHTDGVLGNVATFVNYYEANPGEATIHLTNKKTGQSAGDATFTDVINPVGGTLTSYAASSQQILVDYGDWASRSVTRSYSSKYNGTMSGADVNHSTMPWYLHEVVVGVLS